ncbi:50S ribosomal protein L13 [bacterium]|nr:50S ribosomal protein L13 [bacterium]
MKIYDGKGAVLGRLASKVAKEALQGEEIAILNCEEIIITGGKVAIKKAYLRKRDMIGHSQKGPKHARVTEKMVKRVIRGMLPNFRWGRGREAFKRIKCYVGIPREFEGKKIEAIKTQKKNKFSKVKDFAR